MMDWNNCLDEGNSVKITANKKRAAFLVKQAENTLSVLYKIKIDESNASVFFTNYYDALLELLHAMMYAEGYKVKNHYCLGYYLRDVMKDHRSFDVFDRSRQLRNSTIYYGDIFEKAVLLEAIKQIKLTFIRLRKKIM
jgi:hypothetical protein